LKQTPLDLGFLAVFQVGTAAKEIVITKLGGVLANGMHPYLIEGPRPKF